MCPYRILVKSLEILARRWIWIGDIGKLEINDSIKLHVLSEIRYWGRLLIHFKTLSGIYAGNFSVTYVQSDKQSWK